MNRTKRRVWAVLALVLVLSTAAFAQAGRGKARLSGTVADEKGEPVADAEVKIEYEKGGLVDKTTTNKKGEFFFLGLGTGRVIVTASAENFLDGSVPAQISQLADGARNFVSIVLKEDKERKLRLKDAAALDELVKGNQLFAERKFDEALAIYQDFAQNNPEVFQIYFNIGDVYREKGEFDKANEQYLQAQARAREKADIILQAKAFASLGEVCLRQEKFKEAGDYFTQSIALNPKDEILAYNVAEIFFGRNQTDKAIEYYKLATQIKPEWSEPYLKMGYAYLNKGDMKAAIAALNEFLKRDPESPQAPVVQSLIESLSKTK